MKGLQQQVKKKKIQTLQCFRDSETKTKFRQSMAFILKETAAAAEWLRPFHACCTLTIRHFKEQEDFFLEQI